MKNGILNVARFYGVKTAVNKYGNIVKIITAFPYLFLNNFFLPYNARAINKSFVNNNILQNSTIF